jgi:tetratricopeptide (TPR) repeat protein
MRPMNRLAIAVLLALLAFLAPARADQAGAADYLAGLEAMEAARWAEALAAFGRAVSADDQSADFRTARGAASTLSEDFAGAIKDLERSLRLRPEDKETKVWLAAALRMSGEIEKAPRFFTHGEDMPADYADFIYNRMAMAYWQSKFRGSYYDWEQRKTIEVKEPMRKDFPRAGQMFAQRHKTAGAAPGVAGDAGAGAASLMLERAKQLLGRGEFQAAMKDLAALRARSPQDLEILALHAHCALGLHDAATARAEFTRVLIAHPDGAGLYLGRALAAARLGDIRRAQADIAVAAALDSMLVQRQRPAIEQEIARRQPGDPAAALKALLHAADASQPWEELVKLASAVHESMNNRRRRYDETYQDRLRVLEAAVKAAPSSAEALADLARFLFDQASVLRERVEPRGPYRLYRHQTDEEQRSEIARAEKLADEALKLSDRSITALSTKAAILAHRHDFDGARELIRRALAIEPANPDLVRTMAALLEVAAAQRAAKAADLRETKTWYSMEWMYIRWPSQAELEQADALEAEASELVELAARHLAQAAKLLEGSAQGFSLAATMARREGDLPAALAAVEKSIALEQTPEAYLQRAAIQTELGQFDDAVASRSAAANLVETTAAHLLIHCQMKLARTAYRDAGVILDSAAAVDPADPRVLAYRGVLHEGNEEPARAISCYRAALALVEASAALHGQSITANGSGPVNDDDLGTALALRLRLARLLDEAGRADEAIALCTDNLALESRLGADDRLREIYSAMLPDPAGLPGEVPEADPMLALLARSRVRVAEGALAAKRLGDANREYQLVLQAAGSWPATRPGRERMNEPSARARVGLARVALARGQADEAFRIMTHDGFPGGLPADLAAQIKSVNEEIRVARQSSRGGSGGAGGAGSAGGARDGQRAALESRLSEFRKRKAELQEELKSADGRHRPMIERQLATVQRRIAQYEQQLRALEEGRP